jgi:DNA-directed RNA polymerase specialized sigma24 family protein
MTEKSRLILEAIAKGHSYEQILVQELAWTYHDIFSAAAEALASDDRRSCAPPPDSHQPAKAYSVDDIRTEHAQAYVKWDAAQDEELRELFRAGRSVTEIARHMGRQTGGIKSRLEKLGLTGPR